MSTESTAEVHYLIGDPQVLESRFTDVPYSDLGLGFCAELSKAILCSPAARAHPDLAQFAFYCRRSSLEGLRADAGDLNDRLGWGIALHIAPSNIPINFAYSFLFGLLAGNANVVRVPSEGYPQIEMFCELMSSVLSRPEFLPIAANNAFVRFPRDSAFLAETIGRFDVVIVWGGDRTIRTIRQLERAPRSIELVFADRYSCAVLGAAAVRQLDDEALQNLCADFYNDTFLVDQNACSSPQLVCWIGDADAIRDAKARFWPALARLADTRYEIDALQQMDKQSALLGAIQRHGIDPQFARFGTSIVVAQLDRIFEFNDELRGSYGLFFETGQASVETLIRVANKKYQTLLYYGVEPGTIRRAVFDMRCKGIDRIVPVGSALDIGVVWDGYDLIRMLSRRISVRRPPGSRSPP